MAWKWEYNRIKVEGKWVLEHRYVMEQYLGRKLKTDEQIHHKDGNPKNNNIDNLEIVNKKIHNKYHHPKKRKWCICKNCKKKYAVKMNQYRKKLKEGTNFFCSRRCIGLYLGKRNGNEKIKELISKEIKAGLTGYQIIKKHNISKTKVYYYLKQIKG